MSRFETLFNKVTQFLLPVLTLGGMLLISLKHPGLGLVLAFLAQPFWLYSTYRAWKKEGQIGMFVNTLAYAAITGFGVVNYYFLS
jgi:hypothetical protein